MIAIKVFLVISILLFLHEMSHALAAKILGLTIDGYGFKSKPYPHFYVSAERPRNEFQKYFYLLAGLFSTLVWATVCWFIGWTSYDFITWAFILQISAETNPFYSDFTIAIIDHKIHKQIKTIPTKKDYDAIIKKHQFSIQWYIHFILWATLVISLTKYVPHLI